MLERCGEVRDDDAATTATSLLPGTFFSVPAFFSLFLFHFYSFS